MPHREFVSLQDTRDRLNTCKDGRKNAKLEDYGKGCLAPRAAAPRDACWSPSPSAALVACVLRSPATKPAVHDLFVYKHNSCKQPEHERHGWVVAAVPNKRQQTKPGAHNVGTNASGVLCMHGRTSSQRRVGIKKVAVGTPGGSRIDIVWEQRVGDRYNERGGWTDSREGISTRQ